MKEHNGSAGGSESAAIIPWTPHRLGHAFATRVRKEFGLDAARAALGHDGGAVTLRCAELDCAKAPDRRRPDHRELQA